MTTLHEHCWHCGNSYSTGFGGSETWTCCHCGIVEIREWEGVQDPSHGPYVSQRLKKYKTPAREAAR